MNLKDIPENVQKRVDNKHFLKAYHMNKTLVYLFVWMVGYQMMN